MPQFLGNASSLACDTLNHPEPTPKKDGLLESHTDSERQSEKFEI